MSNSLKNILQVIVIIILLAGVSYLGFKLISFNNVSRPETTQTPTNTSPDQGDVSEGDPTPEGVEQCDSNDDCTIISDTFREKGDTKTVIQCLNKAYLSTCETCKTSEELVKETTEKATCTCTSQNLCELRPNSM